MHEKLYVPNAQDSNAFPKVVIYFQRQSYGRLCCGRQLDRRRNRRLATNFASNCSMDDPKCVILSRGRTDPVPLPSFILCMGCRDLLLSLCRSVARRGPATESEMAWKTERRRDICNILVHCQQLLDASCCLRID